jgi:hypothetical protein
MAVLQFWVRPLMTLVERGATIAMIVESMGFDPVISLFPTSDESIPYTPILYLKTVYFEKIQRKE